MSNENKNENEYQEYQDYEFCKAVECSELIKPYDKLDSKCNLSECVKTAKEFHKWLEMNLYEIVKKKAFRKEICDDSFKNIRIVTTVGVVTLIGRYRRDLEKTNWHYYETEKGDILHFRKEHLVAVLEDENESFTTFES